MRDTAMTYRAPINDMLLALNHGAGLAAAGRARGVSALDGARVERGVGSGSVRRPGPAARDQRRLHRNLERVEHRLRPLPAADALRDRGARRPWQRGAEEDLSRKAGDRRMDRHYATHGV